MARTKTDNSAEEPRSTEQAPNPVWFKPVMFGFMILGFLWIIIYYMSGQQFPIAAIGNLNLLVGFGIVFIGFLMTTRWR